MPALAHEALPPVTWPVSSAASPASAAQPRIASQAPVAGGGSPTSTPGTSGASEATAVAGDGGGPNGARGQQIARSTPGGGAGEPGGEYGPWLGRLRDRIQASLSYPAVARRRGISGIVTLEMTIQPSGVIGDVRVVESSSHTILDSAAVEAVRDLPAQPIPADLPRRSLRVRLPIVFQLR